MIINLDRSKLVFVRKGCVFSNTLKVKAIFSAKHVHQFNTLVQSSDYKGDRHMGSMYHTVGIFAGTMLSCIHEK